MSVSLRNGDSAEIYSPLAEINVTPLVDVMLVLLIIFMVTAPLLTPGVKVDLPKAAAAKSLNPKAPLIVSVGRDGQLAFGADPISLDALGAAVKAKMGDDPTQVVHIRGDKLAPFGEVVKAMDRLTLAGVAHIAIVTAPGAPAPEPAR
ncbi:MAG: biopolymer transporter ExbD [Pseudomonadota bacterium]|nr:biopolymer transporter ExbD [Pseudomonadota bacterium]